MKISERKQLEIHLKILNEISSCLYNFTNELMIQFQRILRIFRLLVFPEIMKMILINKEIINYAFAGRKD